MSQTSSAGARPPTERIIDAGVRKIPTPMTCVTIIAVAAHVVRRRGEDDGIRTSHAPPAALRADRPIRTHRRQLSPVGRSCWNCLLYTSDAADERSSVDLGG